MRPYPHPDGAIAFRRAPGGEFVIREDDRGRWSAYYRTTIYDWHFAYGDQISLTRFHDVPLVSTVPERTVPSQPDPVEVMRTVNRMIDLDEVTWEGEDESEDDT